MKTTKTIRNVKHRRQLRGFIAVWLGVTLLVGVATFVGIYLGTANLEASASAPLPEVSAPQTTSSAAALPAADVEIEQGETTDTITENTDSAPPQTEPDTAAPLAQEAPSPTPNLTPTIPPRQDRDFDLGIQIIPAFTGDPNQMNGYMDAAANQLNLNWIKLQVRWELVEPEPGVYDWARQDYNLDLYFQTAAEKNLKVLISVVTTPDWARESGADLNQHGPPADNQVFANFIVNMLQRYPGQIHAVEVWNEMNLAREWTSPRGLSAADYVRMVTTVANSIRFVDPNIIVVSGALSPTGVDDGVNAISDFRYTDELIANGLLGVVDCFGAHHNGYNIGPRVPYNEVPPDPNAVFRGPFDNQHPSWSFYSTLTTYANKIRAAGSNVPLCVTEFGWAVAEDLTPEELRPLQYFEFSEDNTLLEQRDYLVEAIQMMGQEWDFVWLAFIWNLNLGPETQWDISRPDRDNIPYSLVRPNYVPAPAWSAIADMNFRGQP